MQLLQYSWFGQRRAPVEDLLTLVNKWSSLISLNLWVPESLTLNGGPVTSDVAMAIVVDAALAIGPVTQGLD